MPNPYGYTAPPAVYQVTRRPPSQATHPTTRPSSNDQTAAENEVFGDDRDGSEAGPASLPQYTAGYTVPSAPTYGGANPGQDISYTLRSGMEHYNRAAASLRQQAEDYRNIGTRTTLRRQSNVAQAVANFAHASIVYTDSGLRSKLASMIDSYVDVRASGEPEEQELFLRMRAAAFAAVVIRSARDPGSVTNLFPQEVQEEPIDWAAKHYFRVGRRSRCIPVPRFNR